MYIVRNLTGVCIDDRFPEELLCQAAWTEEGDGCVGYASQFFQDYVGLRSDELRTLSSESILHPQDIERYVWARTQALQTGGPVEVDARIRRAQDQEYRWHLIRLSAAKESTSRPAGERRTLALATEIHERKLAEERVRLAQLAAGAGIWEWDFETGLSTFSPECFALFGLDPETVARTHGEGGPAHEVFLSCIVPEDRERLASEVEKARVTGEGLRQDFRVICSGELRCLTTVGSTIHHDGNAVRMVGVTIDVTEARKAEEAAKHNARLDSIGRLAGGVAHDFNNLLAGILGGASFLQETLPENHSARPILDVIMRASERAALLTKQLLAYSGKSTTALRRVEFSSAIREACSLAHAALPSNVELSVEIGSEALPVDADVHQIRDIVMNLALNAADAIGEQPGHIHVRTGVEILDRVALAARFSNPAHHPGAYAFLEVQDTGEGMSPEVLRRMYEPFFTTRFTGRGLGLSAVQGFVRAHCGMIEVKSAVGKGSTFRIFFPIAVSRDVTGYGTSPDKQAPGVLVIDDEEAVRHIAHAALGLSGYDVLTASDGATGIELFREHGAQISIVLLDVSMPGLSGAAVFEKLREIRPDVPVLITSGYTESDAISQFPEGGPAGFVQKPFTVRQLSVAVKRVTAAAAHGD